MNTARLKKFITAMTVTVLAFASILQLHADDTYFSKTMSLSTGVNTGKILNLTNYNSMFRKDYHSISTISSSQLEQAMSGFLNRETESYGYYMIELTCRFAGYGDKHKAVTTRTIIGGAFTLGLSALFMPVSVDRYEITATLTIYDINRNKIESFTNSDRLDLKDYMRDTDYTDDTGPVFRRLVKNNLLSANERSEYINTALISAKPPLSTHAEKIAQNAHDWLSQYIARGTRVAIIGIRAEKSDEGNLYLNALSSVFVTLRHFDVVDRRNIETVLGELGYQWIPFVDKNTSTEIGGHLGAQVLIFGDIGGSGGNKTLTLQAISVYNSQVIAATTVKI
jgi:hypothetical protein